MVSAMHCGSCGAPLWPGSEICAGCGADLRRQVPITATGSAPPAVTIPAPTPAGPPAGFSRGVVSAIVACAVAAAAGLAVILATHTPAKNEPISLPNVTDIPGFTEIPTFTQLPSFPNTSDPVVAPGTTPGATATSPNKATHVWHLVQTASDGSSDDLTLSIGAPEPATAGKKVGVTGQIDSPQLSLDLTCDHIDPAVDAVLAVQVVMQNKTSRPTPIGYTFEVNGPTQVDAIEMAEPGGRRCKVGLDATAVVLLSNDTLQPGTSRTTNMFFVLHHYYDKSPAEREARLESTQLLFSYADGASSAGTDELLTPGPLIGPDVGHDGSVSLAG